MKGERDGESSVHGTIPRGNSLKGLGFGIILSVAGDYAGVIFQKPGLIIAGTSFPHNTWTVEQFSADSSGQL